MDTLIGILKLYLEQLDRLGVPSKQDEPLFDSNFFKSHGYVEIPSFWTTCNPRDFFTIKFPPLFVQEDPSLMAKFGKVAEKYRKRDEDDGIIPDSFNNRLIFVKVEEPTQKKRKTETIKEEIIEEEGEIMTNDRLVNDILQIAQKANEDLKRELREAKNKMDEMKENEKKDKRALEKVTKKCKFLQEEVQTLERMRPTSQKKDAEIEKYKKKVENQAQNLEWLNRLWKEMKDKRKKEEAILAEVKIERDQLKNSIVIATKELSEIKKENKDLMEENKKIGKLNDELTDAETKLEEVEKKLKIAEEENCQLAEEVYQLEKELADSGMDKCVPMFEKKEAKLPHTDLSLMLIKEQLQTVEKLLEEKEAVIKAKDQTIGALLSSLSNISSKFEGCFSEKVSNLKNCRN